MSAEQGEDVTIPPAFNEGADAEVAKPKPKVKRKTRAAKPKDEESIAERSKRIRAERLSQKGPKVEKVMGTVTKLGRDKIFTGKGVGKTYEWKDRLKLPRANAEVLETKGWFEIDD